MKLDGQRLLQLTKELVAIKSVVGTPEESNVSIKIEEILRSLPYFKKHPEKIFLVENEEDPLGRQSLMVSLEGQKEESTKTVVLIGHIDTVGISDYGDLSPYATNPTLLMEKLQERSLPPQVREDLSSGSYLFGRGVLDMKSGVAMIVHLLEVLSKDLSQVSGNLVAAFVSDEEGNSKGMLSCVPQLVALKERHGYDYTVAIDTDYTSMRTLQDPHRYLYAGTIGKLMPSFYILGKETHVGDPFGGLDPNELAAELVRRINLNVDFSDESMGEVTVPPVTLRLRDLKPEYSVQTNRDATVYFNYATHSQTPDEVLQIMKAEALEAFDDVLRKLQKQYHRFTKNMQMNEALLPWKAKVVTYEELLFTVAKKNQEVHKYLDAYAKSLLQEGLTDERDLALMMVKKLHELSEEKEPMMVLYFSPPYYPHMAVTGKTKEEAKLLQVLESLTRDEGDHPIVFRKFYPYISDLSYFSLPEEASVDTLKGNMPGFGLSYKLPLEDIRKLSLPVANIGPYGFDAHQYTERIHMEYSYENLPALFLETVLTMMSKEDPAP